MQTTKTFLNDKSNVRYASIHNELTSDRKSSKNRVPPSPKPRGFNYENRSPLLPAQTANVYCPLVFD